MTKFEVFSPFDGKKVGEVDYSSKDEALAVLDRAYEVYNDYSKRLPKYQIIEILEKAITIIEEQKEDIINMAASEGGKPYIDSKVEVERGIDGIKVAIAHIRENGGKEIPMGQTKSSGSRMAYTTKEPIGVVLSISAFNHPFNLAIHQVISPLAAGCPVIIKPASSTPLSAFKLVEILHQAGLPKDYATALLCDIESINVLAQSKKISYLSFIGSAKVGWNLKKNLYPGVRCALEHGGVAPVIVDKNVNLDDIITPLVKGGFYHAGQVCVSVQRIYAHKDIAKDLANKIAAAASKLKVGDPLDKSTEVGPLITKKEIERVGSWVDEARDNGAEVLSGGKALSESCYAPTVIFNPKDSDKVSLEEVFGPVVCVYEYGNVDEAIAKANSLEVTFQSAVFSKDIDFCLGVAKRLNATAVMINDNTAFRVDWMPFGGAKSSGIGVGGIGYSIDEMSNTKLLVIKSNAI